MDLQRKLEREHATLMKNAFRLARAYCEEHIDGKPDQFQYLETSARTFWGACNAVQSAPRRDGAVRRMVGWIG